MWQTGVSANEHNLCCSRSQPPGVTTATTFDDDALYPFTTHCQLQVIAAVDAFRVFKAVVHRVRLDGHRSDVREVLGHVLYGLHAVHHEADVHGDGAGGGSPLPTAPGQHRAPTPHGERGEYCAALRKVTERVIYRQIYSR